MPIPSKGFVNSLNGLDPLLKVEWGNEINQWVITRKAQIPLEERAYLKKRRVRLEGLIREYEGHVNGMLKLQKTYKSVGEELRAASNGRRVILFTPELNQHIYDALVLGDMSRYGGYARFADKLEEKERAEELELERKQREQRMAMNKEAFDMLHHVWAKKEEKLLAGERDLKYLLHGKRTEPGEGPLIRLTDF